MSAAAQSLENALATPDVNSPPAALSAPDVKSPYDIVSSPDLLSALIQIMRGYSAHAGTVHLLDSYGLLHLVASEGISESVREKLRTVPLGKGAAGLAIERRQAINFSNLRMDANGEDQPDREPTGLKQALALPIFRGEAVIGALGIETSNERTFSEIEIAALLDAGRSMATHFLGTLRSSGR
jgi:signal transduction protein with GAF and PtsI domain